jgi:hypothetical protein
MARGLEAQTFRGMTANAATQEPKKKSGYGSACAGHPGVECNVGGVQVAGPAPRGTSSTTTAALCAGSEPGQPFH